MKIVNQRKEKIEEIFGIVFLIFLVVGFIYVKFILKEDFDLSTKTREPMSAEEYYRTEQDLINRYGSIENAEQHYLEQGGSGVGHPMWND